MASRAWRSIKRLYVGLPAPARPLLVLAIVAPYELSLLLKDALTLRPGRYLRRWTRYGDDKRGMSRLRDHIDWIGGYPFEVASAQSVIEFLAAHGFALVKLVEASTGLGNNQFVFSFDAHSGSLPPAT